MGNLRLLQFTNIFFVYLISVMCIGSTSILWWLHFCWMSQINFLSSVQYAVQWPTLAVKWQFPLLDMGILPHRLSLDLIWINNIPHNGVFSTRVTLQMTFLPFPLCLALALCVTSTYSLEGTFIASANLLYLGITLLKLHDTMFLTAMIKADNSNR